MRSLPQTAHLFIIDSSSGSSSVVERDLANPFLLNEINNLTGHGVAAK
jgi:hypothetical protein